MEVGDGEDGCTKSVAGTGVSPLDGTGDMTCALPSEDLEVETFAVCKSADHTSECEGYEFAEVLFVFGHDLAIVDCCYSWAVERTGGNPLLAATLDCSNGDPEPDYVL